ncbi:MAG TPA: lipopolysaccharide kinase InaA family protein [Holophagaceae bacterium]|nr:lipopolysaccharide kinase InaA family protein [Holophagaceae bacterium]
MTSPILIPPLPSAWPYEPRTVLPSLDVRGSVAVPGCGEGWTLESAPGLDLSGEAGILQAAFGRGGVHRLGGTVLRPYRRGGLVAKLNAATYASPGRFRRELAVHRALWEAGFPTVEPLGLAWRRAGLGVEGLYFTRLTDARPWPADWSATVTTELLKALKALSAWGLFAPDLNATNVLWGDAGLVLLDWDRAAWRGGALLRRYQARLQRSLAKLGAPDGLRAALDQGFASMGSSRS